MSNAKSNFGKSIIYKIVCKDLQIKDVYVDSTRNLAARIAAHKHWAKNPEHQLAKDRLLYSTVDANLGWDNWTVVFIERYPCADQYELHARVRYWIEQLGQT